MGPRIGSGGVGGRSCGPGGDLLFRALRRSTIGAEGFHGRVRDGIGCFAPRYGHQAGKTAPSQLAKGDPDGKRVVREVSVVRAAVAAAPVTWCGAQVRYRAISTGQLHGLPRFHLRPINVVVYHGSQRDLVLR